jgi:hypothetical protein
LTENIKLFADGILEIGYFGGGKAYIRRNSRAESHLNHWSTDYADCADAAQIFLLHSVPFNLCRHLA